MYWVCEDCGWENEYGDSVRYTHCQCCGAGATAKNIADASRALERFHREAERLKRMEALRLGNKKRQQAIDGVMRKFVRFLRILPFVNIAAFVIAAGLFAGSFLMEDVCVKDFFSQAGSNIQSMLVPEQTGGSLEMTRHLVANRFSSFFGSAASNHQLLADDDFCSHLSANTGALFRNVSCILEHAPENITEYFNKIFMK
ncbi:MAG: hypothetical protein IKY17_00265 [Oscillospiraceae bacterium]|nr:hypothetical protein [Oscillospiraceae bacterium]